MEQESRSPQVTVLDEESKGSQTHLSLSQV